MPLLVLLAALQFFCKQCYAVIGYGICFLDFDLVVGRSNYHIGASGLIYVLVLYLFFKGILTDIIVWICPSCDNNVGGYFCMFSKVDDTIPGRAFEV
jgi:hypothetical protein